MFFELHTRSAFSFLSSGSLPEDFAARAAELGIPGIGMLDRDTVSGAVRFHLEAREQNVKAMIGAEITMDDGTFLPLMPMDLAGYQNLCRLITTVKLRHKKGEHFATRKDIEEHSAGLLCFTGGADGILHHAIKNHKAQETLAWLNYVFDRRLYVELQRHFRVLAYDPRGTGESDRPPGEYSMELWADDLQQLLATLGIARAHVVGSSLGGCVAFELLRRAPALAQSLILVAAFSELDRALEINFRMRIAVIERLGMGDVIRDHVLLWTLSREFIATERGARAAERFIDSLKLWYLATSLGGVESTVSYPLLSSHVGLSKKMLQQFDISSSTIRLSVGIEGHEDLIADLEQALAKA
jgi:hypothetical protein